MTEYSNFKNDVIKVENIDVLCTKSRTYIVNYHL